MQLQTYRPVIN